MHENEPHPAEEQTPSEQGPPEEQRPLPDPCPSWCVKKHNESDRGGDRDHESEAHYVPAVRLARLGPSSPTPSRSVEIGDVLVVAFQGRSETHPWISIGLPEDAAVRLEISPESAGRLCAQIVDVLERLNG
ncbi:hypothetical protein GCM10027416_32690 [Okibacterium endophyticum]